MRKRIITMIITVLCISACGKTAAVSNDNSKPATDISESADAIQDMSEFDESTTDTNNASKEEVNAAQEPLDEDADKLSKKYPDVYERLQNGDYDGAANLVREMKPEASYTNLYKCLENEDYDKAVVIIENMKSERPTETIHITADNWSDYFVFENQWELSVSETDAYGNIKYGHPMHSAKISLKPEYTEKAISCSGPIGVEYENSLHRVINLDRNTGTFEIEIVDSASDPHIMESYNENRSGSCTAIPIPHYGSGEFGYIFDCSIIRSDTNGTYYLIYPEEIDIVRCDVELVLRG